MELRRHEDEREFYAFAKGFLAVHGAHHNLNLGICTKLLRTPGHFAQRRTSRPPFGHRPKTYSSEQGDRAGW